MAGKGGGAWKVAYADFVTAMMAFFLVMWITGQSKPVKEAVAEYFENPIGTGTGNRSTSLLGDFDSLTVGYFEKGRGPGTGLVMSNLKSSAPESRNGTSAVLPPNITLFRNNPRFRSVGTGIHFAEESNELNDAALERLNLVVPLFLEKIGLLEIQAYAPRRPLSPGSPYSDPAELCRARCLAVREYLVKKGIQPARIRLKIDGELEPVFTPHAKGTDVARLRHVPEPFNVFVYTTTRLTSK